MAVLKGHRHFGRAEVVRLAAQTKVPATQIDRIGAIMYGGLEFFHISGRRQQFGFVHGEVLGWSVVAIMGIGWYHIVSAI
jgi:hypothetical protein